MRNCGNCRFMRGGYTMPHPQEGGEPIRAGFCHKTPPTMSPDLQTANHRPVRLVGWCGEHKRLIPWWESAIYWAIGLVISGVIWGALSRIILNSH